MKCAAVRVFVLDEWLLNRPDELSRCFLLELRARHGTASTVFCTQYRQKDWHARLGCFASIGFEPLRHE